MSINIDSLAAWCVSKTKAGKIKAVTEFIDMASGEVIPVAVVQMTPLDLRGKQAKKDAALASLRPEVRKFALFVLGYANNRRGLTPGIDTLCHWYAGLAGKQPQHVRRYIPKLAAVGILDGENLLGLLFQRTGGTARSHRGEEVRAADRFLRDRLSGKFAPDANEQDDRMPVVLPQVFKLEHKVRPAWLVDAEPTGNLMTREIYCELMRRVGLSVAHTAHEVACAHA
ncbi:hypothetical protein LMG18090_02187 [Ralstonia mannitolilytica]|uniref:hypothetical protein n=1 Tax=Ralstonia mannitolilytica TaxID=105219 RepID=UPI0028F61EF9|nr:hypothetical protein [Ralstonia mannitolilytica]CAJ0787930.1 hypothetical protein LMG18090_02187 [Ralstonia mannitolilytica]